MKDTSNHFDGSAPSDPPPRAVSRRSPAENSDSSSGGGRLKRILGERDKLIEGIKTFMWVAPLTILIWIYAERQQLVPNPVTVNNVGIEPQSNDPRRTVRINGTDEPVVSLKLIGPQEGVRKVFEALTQIPHKKLTLAIGANTPEGDNVPINVIDNIQNQELFKSAGVSIQDVQPAQLSVNIDTYDHFTVKVEMPADRPDLSATRIDPPNVTVGGAKRALERSKAGLKAYLRLDGFNQLRNPNPGAYTLQQVPVELSPPGRLQVEPSHVDATVQAAASDVTYEIPDPVYLWIDARPATLEAYSFQLADGVASITHVQVRGPKEQIQKIENKEFIPQARLVITSTDAATQHEAVPVFDLPPGVQVVSDSSKEKIKYVATSRN